MARKKTAPKIGRPLKVNGAAIVSVRVAAYMNAAIEWWSKSARLSRPMPCGGCLSWA